MLKQPLLNLLVPFILVFQDRPDRGCKMYLKKVLKCPNKGFFESENILNERIQNCSELRAIVLGDLSEICVVYEGTKCFF